MPAIPTDSQSLEQFVARCERDGIPYRLSLTQLARECAEARKSGPLPKHLRYLKGYTWFFGYAIDRGTGDVILLGVKDPRRPPIDLDCLVTAIRAAYPGSALGYTGAPGCSLDPHPDRRLQKSRVDGIPWNTRWAEIMLQADYDMKKICQGNVDPRLPGLTSWFDLSLRRAKARPNEEFKQMHRWWFDRPEHDQPRAMILGEAGDLVILTRNPVILMSEKQVGGRFGTGVTSTTAKQFAEDFTRNLESLGRKYRSIGELLALYRLLDLMAHVSQLSHADPPRKDYWFRAYKHPYSGPPRTYPTLSRAKTRKEGSHTYEYSVRGGVMMPLSSDPQPGRGIQVSHSTQRTLLMLR